MSAPEVVLVANCPVPWIYQHRHEVAALYRGRFDRFVLGVGDGWDVELDGAFEHAVGPAAPPDEPERICPCGDPLEPGDWHAVDRHAKHLRMAAVARAAEARGWAIVLYADWDAILGRRWDADHARARLEGHDALAPEIWACPRSVAPERWIWAHHPSGLPSYTAGAMQRLDAARLRRHWAAYAGPGAPDPEPSGAPPLFQGFADVLLARVETWRAWADAAEALAWVWHEAATPTSLVHATDRIGRLACSVSFDPAEHSDLPRLAARLDGHDVVHPIKFGRHSGVVEACAPGPPAR